MKREGYNAEYYQLNRERLLRQQKEYHSRVKAADPVHILFIRLRSRAKEKGLEFNLEEKDIVIPTHCPILQIPLYFGEGRQSGNSPSVDRIDTSKGYVKGNVAIISQRANAAKSNLSIEDVGRMLEYMQNEVSL